MDGEYLDQNIKLIHDLEEQGRAIKSNVTLHYVLLEATDMDASMLDDIEDQSIYVSTVDDTPLTKPPNGTLRVVYTMRRTESGWKVVGSAREP